MDRIDTAEDLNSKRNDLWGLPCFVIIPCLLCVVIYKVVRYPLEFDIKDSAGEKVGGFETRGIAVGDSFRSPGVLHFERMTSEQRRLALVVGMYSTAQRLCHPQEGGGGGGGF